jgi:nanoRNase/pAp phosphatase (c-di-AMP/oligoRNAs hydrolase)
MTVDKAKLEFIFGGLEKNSTVGILLQPSPDPDALGSAAGFSVLLKEAFKLKSKIYHFGEVSHPQNKSMKNILHISLEPGQDFDLEFVKATVVLDTDLANSGFDIPSVDIRIDHHFMERDVEPQLEDVRIVGATCSIIWEYLQEYNIVLDEYADAQTRQNWISKLIAHYCQISTEMRS